MPATSASTSSASVADEREDRAVVIAIGVDVEQPRMPPRARRRIASIVARSRPSEKFGTDSSGEATRRTLGSVKEYYDARAPEYDDWYRGTALRGRASRERWHAEVDRLERGPRRSPARADARRRVRHRLPHAPPAGRGDGLDQSERMLEVARRAGAARELRPGRRARASLRATARSTASSPATSTATSRSADRERFLAEARRVAPELVVVDAAAATEHAEPSEWQERGR